MNIQHFKEKLEKEREEIIAVLDSVGKKVGGDTYAPAVANFGDDTADIEEEEDEAEEFSNRIGINQVMNEQLQRVDAALERIKNDNFGHCENCGKDIQQEILEANPSSTLCLECKHIAA